MIDDTPEEATSAESQNELNTAFSKAQGEMPNAVLNKVNPHFGSRYADIASIHDATVPSLSKHGLGIRQFCRFKGDKLILVTKLAHDSGQSEEGEYPVALDRPQAMGSSLTYARRYNWAAMCGVGSEEDDDAEGAEKPAPKTAYKARKDGDDQTFKLAEAALYDCATLDELEQWRQSMRPEIEKWPDGWQRHMREVFKRHKESLSS